MGTIIESTGNYKRPKTVKFIGEKKLRLGKELVANQKVFDDLIVKAITNRWKM